VCLSGYRKEEVEERGGGYNNIEKLEPPPQPEK
jgi:hypothetical protein